jgi:hypothetical protein
LLGSVSVVTRIAYGADTVTYSTFDRESTDVLRLNFVPGTILVGGKPIARRSDLEQEGYTFNDQTRTLSIRHTSSTEVDIQRKHLLSEYIQGQSDHRPPSYITFDDPHLAAGTPLVGQYPTGVVDWGDGGWQIGTPFGKFGTFTLALSDPSVAEAAFSFYAPHIFAGIDVYNDGDHDATVTVRSPETREQSFTIKPKELRRLRTGWRDTSTSVAFAFTNGQGLRFDNLAYLHQ